MQLALLAITECPIASGVQHFQLWLLLCQYTGALVRCQACSNDTIARDLRGFSSLHGVTAKRNHSKHRVACNVVARAQAGLQGLDQLAPELAVSTTDAFPGPGISLVPGPSHDSEQPSEGLSEARPPWDRCALFHRLWP